MRDRFHDGAFSPNRSAWFATQQEKWQRDPVLNAFGVLIGTDLSLRLWEIACPTLLLHPGGSPFIPVSVMADLRRLLPDAELHAFGRAGHGLPFSHAVQCAEVLQSFLDSCSAGC